MLSRGWIRRKPSFLLAMVFAITCVSPAPVHAAEVVTVQSTQNGGETPAEDAPADAALVKMQNASTDAASLVSVVSENAPAETAPPADVFPEESPSEQSPLGTTPPAVSPAGDPPEGTTPPAESSAEDPSEGNTPPEVSPAEDPLEGDVPEGNTPPEVSPMGDAPAGSPAPDVSPAEDALDSDAPSAVPPAIIPPAQDAPSEAAPPQQAPPESAPTEDSMVSGPMGPETDPDLVPPSDTSASRPAAEPRQQDETLPVSLPDGRAVTPSDAVRVSGEVWNLNGFSKEERSGYDGRLRAYPSSVTTNMGHYSDRHENYAIDDNGATFWETGETNTEAKRTYLDFTFEEPETVGRLVYGCRNDNGGYQKGFAYECRIYASESGETADLRLVATGLYETATTDFISYTFPEQTVRLMRFEFVRSVSNYPSARDFYFYAADEDETAVDGLFTDYAMYQLAPEYKTEDGLNGLAERVKDSPLYETVFRGKFERAEKIISGQLVFNPDLELSTARDAKHRIERYGDVVDYARNKLRYNSFGTNRQATGIAAYGGQTITIYVEAGENDPLPRIRFSQAYGYWSRWLDSEKQLRRGVNTFVVPDLRSENYKTAPVPAAGTVYIVNPYTEEQQSEQVKVYMEGCDTYPVFRKGDDEDAYKKALTDYADRVREDPTGVIDLTELVCDHAIMTVTATRADEIYATESPQANLDNWDKVMHETLAFEGVEFDPHAKYYNPLNEHLNVNYRVSQVWSGGWMFAYTEHIGLYEDAESVLIDSLDADGKSGISWGYVHEMGHMTDLPERTIGETTNNMPANFNNAYFRDEVRNPEYYALANAMSSDREPIKNTFQAQRYNYVIFFLLESYFNGQWGKTDNMYRYEDHGQYADMTLTEKQVYLTSLACGTDLGYYFTRWGYSLRSTEEPFDEEKASQAYQEAMRKARSEGLVVENELPIWYLDPQQYKWMRDNGDPKTQKGAIYNHADSQPEIVRVLKTGNGYSLTMPAVEDDAHLGYEIWEGEKEDTAVRIGFTTSAGFTDTYRYPDGYKPTYRVRAFDRLLNGTAFSEPKQAESDKEVCEAAGKVYDSISEGIAAAGSGGTVYLLKDTADSGIRISFPVTIMPKDSDVTLTRGGDGPVFQLAGGSNLMIQSNGEHTLTLTGADIRQSHALIEAEGNAKFTLKGLVFQDSITTENGGALAVLSSGVNGKAEHCVFRDNHAEKNGGAVYNFGTVTLSGCTFTGNTAAVGGGAFCNEKGGVSTVSGCTMTGSTASKGGAIFCDGKTTVTGGAFSENNAVYGGAVCMAPTANPQSRTLSVDGGTQIFANTAVHGGAFYLANGGKASIAEASVTKNGLLEEESETAFEAILNDPYAFGIVPAAEPIEAKPQTEAAQKAKTYDICINNASLSINGAETTLDANLYKAGTFTCLTALPEEGSLRIALAEYTTAEPVTITDFDVTEEDLRKVALLDGSYELSAGTDGRSIYLKAGQSVTFVTNEGTIVSGAITGYIPGTRTKLPANVTREGHTFIGWYEDADFDGHSVKYIEPDETGDKTYYAKWVITTNMIVYETGGGKINGEARKLYTYIDFFELPKHVTYADHIFLGWHEKSDCSDEKVTEVKEGTNRKLTFYANWEHLKTETTKEDVEPSSCTEGGSYKEVITCSVCKKKLSERMVETEPLGHAYSEWEYRKTPDCSNGGVRTRVCTVCGHTETEDLDPNGHTWAKEYTVDVLPTCTTDGSESIHCTVCGVQTASRTIPKRGHTEGSPKYLDEVPATCTQGGSYTKIISCAVCGEELSREFVTVAAKGHDYGEWQELDAPDCGAGGAMIRRCRSCGAVETYGLAPEGHEWDEEFTVDKEPDCVTEGSRSIHCRNCEAVLKSEVLPAKRHDYRGGKCSICGEPELADAPHSGPDAPPDGGKQEDGGNGGTWEQSDEPHDGLADAPSSGSESWQKDSGNGVGQTLYKLEQNVHGGQEETAAPDSSGGTGGSGDVGDQQEFSGSGNASAQQGFSGSEDVGAQQGSSASGEAGVQQGSSGSGDVGMQQGTSGRGDVGAQQELSGSGEAPAAGNGAGTPAAGTDGGRESGDNTGRAVTVMTLAGTSGNIEEAAGRNAKTGAAEAGRENNAETWNSAAEVSSLHNMVISAGFLFIVLLIASAGILAFRKYRK